jgi:predicted Zn-ribbon and HTH transcriptional regulator
MVDFRIFRKTKGVDEVLFGEIIRVATKMGYPMIRLRSDENYHHCRFLTQGTPLFTLDVKLKRFGKKFVLSKYGDIPMRIDLHGMAIIKGSSLDRFMEMHKKDFTNIFKFPILGMIKVSHDNNRVHLDATMIGLSKKYFDNEGTVNRDRLTKDIQKSLNEMLKSLDKFISKEHDAVYIDQAVDMEKEIQKIESDLMLKIQIVQVVPVVCPSCEHQFDTKAKGAIKCPECGCEGELE